MSVKSEKMEKKKVMEQGAIDLVHSIKINGKNYKTLSYDMREITAAQFSEASMKGKTVAVKECDHSFHLYLGFMGIIAVNQEIDISDLERMKGMDLVQVTNLGLGFICGVLESGSPEEDSENASEIIAEPTIQA